MITVYPEEGRASDVARWLLEAAEHPRQVAVVTNPRFGFIVPLDVFERFEAAQNAMASSAHQEAPPAETEPRKRRPGRPRKETVAPDLSQLTEIPKGE